MNKWIAAPLLAVVLSQTACQAIEQTYTPTVHTPKFEAAPSVEEKTAVKRVIRSWCSGVTLMAAPEDTDLQKSLYLNCWQMEYKRWLNHWIDTNHRIRT